MDKLFVYGDFDWLERPELIGELSFESIRGNATYGFSYSKKWLPAHPNVFLSEDLQNFPGVQYTQPQKDIFSCFSDALPDRWGRTLLLRREQLKAAEEKRAVRRLTSFDLLKGIDDASRMGSFRFAETPGGDFINCETDFRVPPFTKINELMLAAHEIEASEAKSILPKEKWINQLIHPGTSLGGARPKASVLDEDGKLTVAKFPSRKDNHDVAQWEHFSHYLAKKAGINAAATKTVSASNYHLLLSRRFDRTNDGKRIHFASALTLLGLNDGDNASSGYGYLDIVDFIIQHGSNIERNLEELYRRVAFYIIIGNADDHFRNHGFLLTEKGWELSPAYDINPTTSEQQSLLINRSTNEADLGLLLDAAPDFMISQNTAKSIIDSIKTAMASWRTEAKRFSLPQRDIDTFGPRIDKWLK